MPSRLKSGDVWFPDTHMFANDADVRRSLQAQKAFNVKLQDEAMLKRNNLLQKLQPSHAPIKSYDFTMQ